VSYNELYFFTMGTEEWTYTSGDVAVVYNTRTYTPVAIGRGNRESKRELSKASLEVNMDVLNPIAQNLLGAITERILGLTLYIQNDAATIVGWKGRLSNLKPAGNKVTLSFESVFTSLRRPGLRARYQKNCRYVLYHSGCNVDPETVASATEEPTSASGSAIVTAAAALQADGYWVGGMVREGGGLYGFIIAHDGTAITLQRPLDALNDAVAADTGYGNNYGNYYGSPSVTLFPGCDHLRGTCLTKFNNLNNFGGFPWIPARSPMDGGSIV